MLLIIYLKLWKTLDRRLKFSISKWIKFDFTDPEIGFRNYAMIYMFVNFRKMMFDIFKPAPSPQEQL